MYFKSAKWGFENLLEQKLSGYGFRFHIIGILASLRAVQHALEAYDKTLSPEHEVAISKWWEKTKDWKSIPELKFIKTSRDEILKQGAFDSYASRHEHSSGGGPPTVEYELSYYVNGKRRDLGRDICAAINWCEKELSEIEAGLPARFEEETVGEDDFNLLTAEAANEMDD
jgi:hypothetical protein